MWLRELLVAGFRNLREQGLEFDSRVNVIFGVNGAGKTNLLEAISLLATGRSFRTLHDRQMLGFSASYFKVAGLASSSSRRPLRINTSKEASAKHYSARVYYSPNEGKHYFLDKREVPKRSLFAGWLPVSVFLLDDRSVVAGAPAGRRAFLDEAIGKLSRTYRFVLAEYRKVLAHRNALLRKQAKNEEFIIWEARIAELAAEIAARRQEYWQEFIKHFARMAKEFLPKDELLLEYIYNVNPGSNLKDILKRVRDEERNLGFTRHGPHRDDFRTLLNGRLLRAYASYGQQRLAALALALAEAQTVLSAGRKPIYIMDDVAAELDSYNTRLLFDLVRSKGQLFYAAPTPPDIDGRRFHVKDGNVRQI